MVTPFRENEISSELLLKSFLKEIFLDDEIAVAIAKKLAQKGESERSRIILALAVVSSTHRNRWDALIEKLNKE